VTPGATPTCPCSGIFGIADPYPDPVRVAEVDDQQRMAAILAYDAVRMPPRAELQGVLELAARIAGVPKATVNIITDTEQHQIATTGFEGSVSPRRDSMCAAIIGAGRPVVLADASRDARFARNPFVTGQLDTIRCYVAHPLITREGVPVGTLCVFDSEPRELDPEQLAALALLAVRTVDVFEVRLRGRELALSQMENQAVQAELERSNERLASFAGQVSHDLKTPLTTLSLSLSLIREQLEDGQVVAESAPLLDRAINVSARMADLIDDVLDYARLGGTFRATEVDLDFVLGKVLEDLAPELVDVTLHIGQLPTVLGDRAQLSAVLQNLLGNAARYRSDERPLEVRIAARHVQRAWRIEITDNGRGVPPAERHRVFEPLARLDDSIEGTGIGLATCRRIVGAHGGRIGIDASVTEGARFWFELPD
jgi:signal transduction histidine kinase